jgi:hypothetical protein
MPENILAELGHQFRLISNFTVDTVLTEYGGTVTSNLFSRRIDKTKVILSSAWNMLHGKIQTKRIIIMRQL